MFKFISDPDNEKECKECCCDEGNGKFCDSQKCHLAEEATGKYCNQDKGYFVKVEGE